MGWSNAYGDSSDNMKTAQGWYPISDRRRDGIAWNGWQYMFGLVTGSNDVWLGTLAPSLSSR